MVSAKLLQIFATGPQDKILYGNPKITYFKTVYKQHTNFGSNYIVKDLSNYADFGKTLRILISYAIESSSSKTKLINN